MEINSIDDVKTMVDNSGVVNWKWGKNTSLEGLIHYIWYHCNLDFIQDTGVDNDLLYHYVLGQNEDPKDYGLTEGG